VYKAAFGQMPPANDAPVAAAMLSWNTGTWARFDSSASFDPEKEPLQYRWDFDYDGEYDTGWMDETEIECGFAELGKHTLKLEVRDERGATGRTLLTFDLTDKPPEPELPDVVEAAADVGPDGADVTQEDAGPGEVGGEGTMIDGADNGGAIVGIIVKKPGSGGCTTSSAASSAAALLLLLGLGLLSVAAAVRARTSCPTSGTRSGCACGGGARPRP
jgi:hypothetical protein